jgi:hypothetical protein
MPSNNPTNQTEQINSVILRLLGLSNAKEIDYNTYYKTIAKKLSSARMVGARIPEQEEILLREELKRIRPKKDSGRFKIKTKTVKIIDSSIPNIQNGQRKLTGKSSALVKATPGKLTKERINPQQSSIVKFIGKSTESSNKSFENIQKSLDSIADSLKAENKLKKKEDEKNRKDRERKKRDRRESLMESSIKPIINAAKKFLEPLKSFWDRLIRFVTFTILGRAFKMFMDWASDPKNKKKIETITRFIKDWWPALLGGWFLFATPLGKFVRTIIGTIAKLTIRLAKFAIPRLAAFVAKNPVASVLIGGAVASGVGAYVSEQNVANKRKQINPSAVTPKDTAKTGKGPGTNQLMQESVLRGGAQAFSNGGTLGGYRKGGKTFRSSPFSGIVNHKTGKKVSGAGPDTQFLPLEDGGGVVLQKGETVLQVGAREKMIQETGHDPLSYNVGSDANKPRNIGKGLRGNSSGGIVGYANGGTIGLRGAPLKRIMHGTGEGIPDLIRNTGFKEQTGMLGKGVYGSTKGWVADTYRGAGKWKGILPGQGPRLDMLVPQASRTLRGATVVSGRQANRGLRIAEGIMSGKYTGAKARSLMPLLAKETPTMAQALGKFLPGLAKLGGKALEIGNLPVIGDMLFPEAAGNYDQLSGQNSYRNAPGYKIPKRRGKVNISKRKDGGMFTGGLIKENSGVNIPGATADRQQINTQPGEYVIPKLVVDRIGYKNLDNLVSSVDTNSNAAKLGRRSVTRYMPSPPIRKNYKNSAITLPPINAGTGGPSMATSKDRKVPTFSAVSSVGYDIRKSNAEIYGIVG